MKKLILIEDSYVMRGLHSVYIARILKRYKNDNSIVVFWKSSGWILNQNNLPCVKDGSFLIGNDNSSLISQDIYEFSQHLSKVNINQIIRNFIDQKENNLDIQDISLMKYKGCRIGLGLLSTALRSYPEVNIEQNLHINKFAELAFLSIISIEYILFLSSKYSLELGFFSETVYQSLFLIDSFTLCGGKCPLLLDLGCSCKIDKETTLESISTGKSSRMLATFKEREKIGIGIPLTTPARNYLNKFLSGSKNTSNLEQLYTTQSFYHSQARRLGYNLYSKRELLSPILYKELGKINIVLYLQGVTDGPFLVGFSGFATPHIFFKSLICRLSEIVNHLDMNIKDVFFIIKPHPNILNGLGSIHPSHLDKARTELKVSKYMLEDLASLLKKENLRFIIIDPILRSSFLLGINNSIHVTHHGTISLEASTLGLPVICSQIAPLAYINDLDNHYIYSKNDDLKKTYNAIKSFKFQPPTLIDQKLIHKIIYKDYYSSKYIDDVLKMFNSFIDCFGIDHDEYIIKNNLSFKCLESNELIKEIQNKIDLVWSYIEKSN